MEQSTEEQLRNLRNAVRFLAEALQGLAEGVKTHAGGDYSYWAEDAIERVDEKLKHD